MFFRNPDDLRSSDVDENKIETLEQPFESSFTYHAIPLDEQMTLDENGVPFSVKELMELKELSDSIEQDD